MRLKLDENFRRHVTQLAREAGHDVATVREQALAGASDSDVYDVCVREDRTLVSLDLDFANSFRFDPTVGAGIAVLRVPGRPSRADLEAGVHTLIGGTRASVDLGAIVDRAWFHRPPVRTRRAGPDPSAHGAGVGSHEAAAECETLSANTVTLYAVSIPAGLQSDRGWHQAP